MTEDKDVLRLVDELEKEAVERWEKIRGTPKTLKGAISNGKLTNDIENHVIDFLSQKFQLYRSGNGDAVDTAMASLWEKIINHD